MSPISLGLDGFLILLLGAALMVGMRLSGKLRDLKDSQTGFIKAVGELDGAAMRAESGLQALREATTEAHDQLLDRIETARGLAARLDRVLPEAESAAAAASEAARAAGDAAARADAAAVRTSLARPEPVAQAPRPEAVVVPLRPHAIPASPAATPEELRSAERAAALFLEERAARARQANIVPSNAAADDAANEDAPRRSRLESFRARRSGGRA